MIVQIKNLIQKVISKGENTMKNTKKELVINGRQVVNGLVIIGMVVAVLTLVVGIVSGDSHLIGEASRLAIFATVFCCLNYYGAKKDKEAKKNAENA